jgi:hypothetical protein
MTDHERWKAVSGNDKDYDGVFLYGVKTTKIFCRPSCKSKLPLRKNMVYFETPENCVFWGRVSRPPAHWHQEFLYEYNEPPHPEERGIKPKNPLARGRVL